MNGPALETVADIGGAYARLHETLAAVLVGQEGPCASASSPCCARRTA